MGGAPKPLPTGGVAGIMGAADGASGMGGSVGAACAEAPQDEGACCIPPYEGVKPKDWGGGTGIVGANVAGGGGWKFGVDAGTGVDGCGGAP